MGSLASELRRIRKVSGLSLRDVESKTDISNAYLSQLERGFARKPSADKLAKLASVYGIDAKAFLIMAGYLPEQDNSDLQHGNSVRSGRRQPSPALLALLEANLDEEDEQLLVDYAAFLRGRKQKAKSAGGKR